MNLLKVPRAFLLAAICGLSTGCGPTPIDTSPARSRGQSINGTGAFVEILRGRGHEVRAAVRTSDTLANWANVIVRFALHPGPPSREEGRWLQDWLRAESGRKVVYVPLDFDAESEFWGAMIAAEPAGRQPWRLEELKKKQGDARTWAGLLPPKAKELADAADWFKMEPKPAQPAPCKQLDGPWAEGVDAGPAAISKHEAFQVEPEDPVLLLGDGSPLALSWTLDNRSKVLALANGSFLLNAALLNRARRPLTMRVAEWIGPAPLHVAFVEGEHPTARPEASSAFRLLKVHPFNWISAQVVGFLILLALSFAVRLGRPMPEPPTGFENPSAHPEALGALLARTKQVETARGLIEAYRRWRHPSRAPARVAPAPFPNPPPR